MAENWITNTRYPPVAPNRDNFLPMNNLNFLTTTYGSILAPNQAYMLENIANYSCQMSSEHAEFFEQDGMYSIESIELLTTQVAALSSQIAAMNNEGRKNFGAAAFYNEEWSSMDEARFINNNGSYAGYRGNYYSNQYHPILHNHENILYASYSDERKPSLEDLLNDYANESSKRLDTSLDEIKPSLEHLLGEFATNFSKRMESNEQRLDDLELHMVDLGAILNLANQMCQIATAVNDRERENFVDDDNDKIESTPTYEEPIKIEHDEGGNGKEEMYNLHDDIFILSYPQHSTQLFESQSNQALETFKKLHSNDCFVEIEIVAHEDLKRKRIENSDEWSFKEQEPPGMENWASVVRRQHEDLSTMGWSIDNIIGETPIVELDFGKQCLRRVLPKYTRYFDPP